MEQTINEGAAGSSPEAPLASPGGELISTVEYRTQEPATESPAGADTKADKTDDKQASTGPASGDQTAAEKAAELAASATAAVKADTDQKDIDRLDQHPRFKEVIKEKNDLKKAVADLTAKFDALGKADDKGNKEKAVAMDDMDDTAIFEKLNSNPKQFLNDLAAKIKADTLTELTKASEQEASKNRVISDLQDYAGKNPNTKDGSGFDQMWDSGAIKTFMESHPGHNPMSAHMSLTMDSRIKDAAEKAAAEAVEKAQKQFQAKRGAAVLSGGPTPSTITHGGNSADLSNTKSMGGRTAAIAARLERMRAGG